MCFAFQKKSYSVGALGSTPEWQEPQGVDVGVQKQGDRTEGQGPLSVVKHILTDIHAHAEQ